MDPSPASVDRLTNPTGQPVLRRTVDDEAVIGGVAGGLARYLGVDPVWLRVAFVALAIGGGSGILIYLVLWVAIPPERPGDLLGPRREVGNTAGIIVGTVLVAIGTIALLDLFVPWLDRVVVPALIIAVGGALIWGGLRR